MRIRRVRHIIMSVLLIVSLLAMTGTVYAKDGGVELQDKAIRADENTDLFKNMKEMIPGQTAASAIELRNSTNRRATFYLHAEPDTAKTTLEGKTYREDLLRILELTLMLDDEVLYQGPVSGNPEDALPGQVLNGVTLMSSSKKQYGIELPTIKAGDKKVLHAELHVPESLGNEYQNACTSVNFVFSVYYDEDVVPAPEQAVQDDPVPEGPVRTPHSSTKPEKTVIVDTDKAPERLPKTGFEENPVVSSILIIGAITLGSMGAELRNYKRKRTE